jgi:glucokinase
LSRFGGGYGVGIVSLTAGFDLGGTKLLGVVADGAGTVVASARTPTGRTPDSVFSDLAGLLDTLTGTAGPVDAVGFGVAGLVDRDGVVRRAPNLVGWDGLPARSRLEDLVGLPVVVDNDANVAAHAELRFGAARGCSDVVMVTLGTGIGGAVIAGGAVYRGAQGLAAEFGHITVDVEGAQCACGAFGHWEAIASGSALGRLGRQWAARGEAPAVVARAGGDPEAVTGVHVGDAAQAGEPDAVAILDVFAGAVAVGLGGLVDALDPEVIVIGGGLAELGDVLVGPVTQALDTYVVGAQSRPLPPVVVAVLGERAGAIGAASVAAEMPALRGPAPSGRA